MFFDKDLKWRLEGLWKKVFGHLRTPLDQPSNGPTHLCTTSSRATYARVSTAQVYESQAILATPEMPAAVKNNNLEPSMRNMLSQSRRPLREGVLDPLKPLY